MELDIIKTGECRNITLKWKAFLLRNPDYLFFFKLTFFFLHLDRGSYVEKLMSSEGKTRDSDVSLLKVEDRIVWLSDYGPEYGIVKWIGHLPEEADLVAGIEFVSTCMKLGS